MIRPALAVIAVLCALSVAPGALACVSLVPAERLPGETEADLIGRAKRMHQDELRAGSESVYLGSGQRREDGRPTRGRLHIDAYSPALRHPLPHEPPLLRASPLVTGCEVQPELGHVYVVYAERRGTGWRVIEIVRHADLQDRPPGMPTAREVARGIYPLRSYPE